ncbi:MULTISPECIES: glycosyl hydrolase family 8 [unclassified Agrobacterium]|uniref:glycosyl hydrolase family 8 n=1 Tax=unclassified Agrobacterium TaxID=2632611 RepID=UPI002446D0EB|nr:MULTISPECIES: glycosyl hydrolase family 8 [unclassified Agrobacterium]MDH0616341.1 glycosyl hydrolase family 8 [Agrobacterium sp. GD03872]MDH0698914.1 glycosyl hydrolase family 8 [Agrobacterium sp. GD03871]MDH1061571.1 glycosyl hydrolase family 8 [Agrobacterium sp. GD03992]MDH2213100.1 glycosyl hydrolase family 8 [Agrobacterium sp. GD03643]MDH2222783.1 glycosyl hydrolase family 8 [Agrobacterium sp. GD03638]
MRNGISKLVGIFCLSVMAVIATISVSRAASVTPEAWSAYKGAFLDSGGRIIDTGNGNISHSEGQGYGMWLAVLADNLSDFELIWSFTRTELLVRDDGLSAWKWDPRTKPHVTDINNATDGDILIAYALALAAGQWNRQDYAEASAAIASAILKKTVVQRGGRTLLLPAASGFDEDDREDGPVVNPSYLIFEAFPVLDLVAPSPLWKAIADDGAAQIGAFSFSDRKLPADWVSVKTKPQPAAGFPPEFGYNAVRIPLYLARANIGSTQLLARLKDGMTLESGAAGTFDLKAGTVKDVLSDPGYRIIPALAACIGGGPAVSAELKNFQPTLYYPSTLHLLALSFLARNNGECR